MDRSWSEEGDHNRYIGAGFVGEQRRVKAYPQAEFLRDVFAGKKLSIEFQPYGSDDNVVAEFNLEGLGEEYRKHSECSAQ